MPINRYQKKAHSMATSSDTVKEFHINLNHISCPCKFTTSICQSNIQLSPKGRKFLTFSWSCEKEPLPFEWQDNLRRWQSWIFSLSYAHLASSCHVVRRWHAQWNNSTHLVSFLCPLAKAATDMSSSTYTKALIYDKSFTTIETNASRIRYEEDVT